jgi:hypoxanthine phosphoribosyltransferase
MTDAMTDKVLAQAECLYDIEAVEAALDKLANQLNQHYANLNPLLLCVMKGALVTMGQLLPKLTFPLEIDYIHATRYGNSLNGGEVQWQHKPETELKNRHIILIEDIVDQGDTLNVLRRYCLENKVKSVACATLVNKSDVSQSCQPAEFVGLTVPNRYVFGFGLDYQGQARQFPGIYALLESQS